MVIDAGRGQSSRQPELSVGESQRKSPATRIRYIASYRLTLCSVLGSKLPTPSEPNSEVDVEATESVRRETNSVS